MDAVFDFIGDLFIDLFADFFFSLIEHFIPQKVHSPKTRKIIHITLSIVALIILVLFSFGVLSQITAKGQSLYGWILISLGILYLLFGIILKIISYAKKKAIIQSWIDNHSKS